MPGEFKYHYFVSYAHSRGFGSSEFYRKQPITEYADLQDIRDIIENENGCDHVVIISFKQFDKPNNDSPIGE